MTSAAVQLFGVSHAFRSGPDQQPQPALHGIDLTISQHEVVCVLGPSGCGKSTILNLIAGFLTPTEGKVLVGDTPIRGVGRDRIMVFQAPVLFPWMTVLDNVLLVGRARGVDRERVKRRAHEMLGEVGLSDFRSHYPYQLSGGMRQRLQLARALTAEPEVLLLDEPFGALDAQTRLIMQEMLQEIIVRLRPTIVFITHDIEEALFLGDRVILMSARPGHILMEHNVQFARPRTLDVFAEPQFAHMKTELMKRLHSEVAAPAG